MIRRVVIAIMVLSFGLSAATAGDTVFENEIVADGIPLKLNGSGVREKFWIDLYAVGLYLPKKERDAQKILEAKEPQLLRLVIVSSFISDKTMRKGIMEGFEKATGGDLAPLKSRIAKFVESFADRIEKGDVFELFYRPGSGLLIVKNGKEVETIEGDDFKRALFAIWLGDKPAQKRLKENLLGK
ncbi:chalcone isomerase family protein [Hydrogenimonas cancrithermarum]|uniref:Chalcone isomerase domain-containing protein n=1 Tax=Hydrogenimonas cancrithermarum TaxID=2993563 RepID=A0ABM8FMK6_9BACT|nr:chalcone isomerase family protein [Hydrogenimonas cancrithermarum]BDY13628.1 hypothetical protein HCR_19400 [Hydrogenimonas cancrithermarum]